jgi:hypothetical protein
MLFRYFYLILVFCFHIIDLDVRVILFYFNFRDIFNDFIVVLVKIRLFLCVICEVSYRAS